MGFFISLWDSVKRRWLIIVLITVLCTAVGVGSSFINRDGVSLEASYTAEATLYVNGYESSEVNDYNYELNTSLLITDSRRIVVGNSVAGEVRRELGEDIMISAPFWINPKTNDNYSTSFVFVDATASNKELAIKAADLAAKKALDEICETLPVTSASIYSSATLSTADGKAMDYGSAALGVAVGSVESAGLNKKNIVLAFLLGLVGSIFMVGVYDLASRRIRSANDVERVLDLPVILRVSLRDVELAASDTERMSGYVSTLMHSHDLCKVAVAGIVAADESSKVARALSDRIEHVRHTVLSTDAQALDTLISSDCILLVIKVSAAKHGEIEAAVDLIKVANVPILGVVLVEK